jgi:hypothetical protein
MKCSRARSFAPLIPALVLLTGCGGGSGEGLDDNGQPPPPAPPANNDFQQIQDTIFTPICTGCHVGANAPRGLRLDAANSYSLLVNVASSEVPGLLRVNPGNPGQSYLVQKIEGTAAVGGRMPLGGAPLPQASIDLVRQWIAAGAPAPQSAAPGKLQVASTIPAAGERVPAGTRMITVIFTADVDASLAAADTFGLRDAFDNSVAIARVSVPAGRANVVELALGTPLREGSYQLEVRGEGPVALADNAGHVLDGDHLVPFDVTAGGAR